MRIFEIDLSFLISKKQFPSPFPLLADSNSGKFSEGHIEEVLIHDFKVPGALVDQKRSRRWHGVLYGACTSVALGVLYEMERNFGELKLEVHGLHAIEPEKTPLTRKTFGRWSKQA